MSTLEVLIAFAIMTLTLTAVILVVFGNQTISIDSQTNIEALSKAGAQLESARALSRQDFSQVASSGPTADDMYQKTLTVESLDSFTKKVTSLVSWSAGGRSLFVQLVTILTDFASVANSCTPTVADINAWKTPSALSWDMGQLGVNGNSGNGFGIENIAVFKGKIYTTMYSTANNGVDAGKTFFAFDIGADPSQPPALLGGINLDPNFAPHTSSGVTYSANEIAIGKYGSQTFAYVANATSLLTGQLQVVDISNPQPVLVKTIKIPSATGYGNSIAYNNGYVYVGLTAGGGTDEFYIYDVGGGTGSPSNPVLKGSYSTGSHAVNDISVKGNYAYLALPDNGNPANEVVTIVDINPNSGTFAKRVGGWNDAANPPLGATNHGEKIFLSGDRAYVGRTYGTNEFVILNAAAAPTLSSIGSKDVGNGNGTSLFGVAVRGNLAFTETSSQFQIWDITNPANVQAWGSLNLSILGGSGSQLDCSGNYFYLPIASSQGQNKDLLGVITASTYSLSNSGDVSVVQGSSGNTAVSRTFVSGFPQSITLSASGLPAGAAASFTNNPCSGTCSSAVTITTAASTPVGTYPIIVSGSAGVTTSFNLIVSAQPFSYSLSNSGTVTVMQGSSGNNTIARTKISGATQPVTLAVSGLPSGASAVIGNNSCSPTCSGTLTITTTAATPTGTYPVTVTGNGGVSTTFNLVVNSPFDYSIASGGNISIKRNSSGSNSVSLTTISGVSRPISLTATGFPSKTSGSLSVGSCSPTCSSNLNITVQNPATPGTYTITVSGSAGDVGAHSVSFTLTITN